MKATKTVTWTSSKGMKMEAIIVATCKLTDNISYSDGWNVNLGKELYESLEISVSMNGKRVESARHSPKVITGIMYSGAPWDGVVANGGYALLGDKVILNKEVYTIMMEAIESLVNEVSQPAEIQEAKTVEAEKEVKKAEKEAKIEAQYNVEIENGLCSKCGTYCYGDCESN